jgi:hypothetical protein
MGNSQAGINDGSTGGITGTHPSPDPLPFQVAPATADEFNTAHLPLIPIACWGVDDIRFAFDSSFVTFDPDSTPTSTPGGGLNADRTNVDPTSGPPQDIRTELALMADLIAENPGCPLSLFGHADPVGSDVYNKALSERRAQAIYALLIFNTDSATAVSLWQQIAGTESWGSSQRGIMQNATGLSNSSDATLYKTYMQTLCQNGPNLAKTDFLAQGADAHYKGDFQGCSEFNPLVLFSQEEQSSFDSAKASGGVQGIAARNAANAPNRRVLGLIFRKGSKVDPAKWPCPRASEGIGGCINRFWADGEARRGTLLPSQRRQFQDTQDTFGCRFYQRLSEESPCESTIGLIHISNILFLNYPAGPLTNQPFKLYLKDRVISGNTGADGLVHQEKVPAGDYRIDVVNRTTYVSAIPLSMERFPWLLDIDAANGNAAPDPADSAAIPGSAS